MQNLRKLTRCGVHHRRILGALCFVYSMTGGSAVSYAQESCSAANADDSENAVFRAVFPQNNTDLASTNGSVFLIAKTDTQAFFLTAYHVLLPADLAAAKIFTPDGNVLQPKKVLQLDGRKKPFATQEEHSDIHDVLNDWIVVRAELTPAARQELFNYQPVNLAFDIDRVEDNLKGEKGFLRGYYPPLCDEGDDHTFCNEQFNSPQQKPPEDGPLIESLNRLDGENRAYWPVRQTLLKNVMQRWSGSPAMDENYNVVGLVSKFAYELSEVDELEEDEEFLQDEVDRLAAEFEEKQRQNASEAVLNKIRGPLLETRSKREKVKKQLEIARNKVSLTLVRQPVVHFNEAILDVIGRHFKKSTFESLPNNQIPTFGVEAAIERTVFEGLFDERAVSYADQILNVHQDKISSLANWRVSGFNTWDLLLVANAFGLRKNENSWTNRSSQIDNSQRISFERKIETAAASLCSEDLIKHAQNEAVRLANAISAEVSRRRPSASGAVTTGATPVSIDTEEAGAIAADALRTYRRWLTAERRGRGSTDAKVLAKKARNELDRAVTIYETAAAASGAEKEEKLLRALYAGYAVMLVDRSEELAVDQWSSDERAQLSKVLAGYTKLLPKSKDAAPDTFAKIKNLIATGDGNQN